MADVELTADEVRHVAALARLGLDDAEVDRLGRELTSILGHVHTISALPIPTETTKGKLSTARKLMIRSRNPATFEKSRSPFL